MESINLENELCFVLNLKTESNNLLKLGNLSESYSNYIKLIEHIEKIKDDITDINNTNFEQIMIQYKFILSNLAMVCHKQKNYKESIKYDRRVIKLDKLFHKSYARLIDCYLHLDDFTLARYYFSLMRNTFPKEILLLYEDIVTRIEKNIEEKDSYINNLKSIFTLPK